MKKLNWLGLFLIELVGVSIAFTLHTARDKVAFMQLLDAIYAQQVTAVRYEALYERLWECYCHPLALNHASREELKQLSILTDTQLDHFYRHLEKNGALFSIYELQVIPEFDLNTIYQLLPFVYVDEDSYSYFKQPIWQRALSKRNCSWLTRYERTLETKQGYQPSQKDGVIPYVGSPETIVTRLSISHPKDFSWGLIASKNAGEAFTWDPPTQRYGFNTWSYYVLLAHKKFLKKLIIGHYQIGYGQGLVVNTGFSRHKSSEAIPIMRTGNVGIRPYTSLVGCGWSGIAATFQGAYVTVTTYYAHNNLDGKVWEDRATGTTYVERVPRREIYNTTSKIRQRGQVNAQIIGSTLVYTNKTKRNEVGIQALYTYYSMPIYPKQRLCTSFHFRGQDHLNLGLFYTYLWKNLTFFGEGAIAKNGGPALLIGLIASLSAKVDVSLLLRSYAKDFHSPYGNAFRENATSNRNEQGLYVGVRIKPLKRLCLAAYYDRFKFPAPRYQVDKPSQGYSGLVKATYQLRKPTLLCLQCKQVEKEKNVPQVKKKTKIIALGKKRNYKVQIKHLLTRSFTLMSEVQWSHYTLLNTTQGYAIAQDMTYKLRKFHISGRIVWFDTADYYNRLFFYEKNVLYSGFNFLAYQGHGMKYGLLLCYKPMLNVRLELKYTLTWYWDRAQIGSHQEAIDGNLKNEVRLQLVLH